MLGNDIREAIAVWVAIALFHLIQRRLWHFAMMQRRIQSYMGQMGTLTS
ncbi:MAG: hypothetical protein RMX68_029085 [Aulosira sp. ZfuVER01]|nr:hypothetical protein [Aulosira sp. DedVER01a]MDZ8052594.1 hypothetical protein [Aulosira sp. ZfuCHP01]